MMTLDASRASYVEMPAVQGCNCVNVATVLECSISELAI